MGFIRQTAIVLIVLAYLPSSAYAAMDIEIVEIYADKGWFGGVLDPQPYCIQFRVVGSNIASISVDTQNGGSHLLTDYGFEWFYDKCGYSSLSEIASDPDMGFGGFGFTFTGQDASVETATVPYDPGVTDPHTGYPEVSYPVDGLVNVPLTPTLTWTCAGGPCGNFAWYMEVFPTAGPGASYETDILDPNATQWTPGTLTADSPYGFWIAAGTLLRSTQVLPTTPSLDEFIYVQGFQTGNEIEFFTIAAQQDLDSIDIDSGYEVLNGVPFPLPHAFYINVAGSGIQRAQAITPGGATLELLSDAGDFHIELFYVSYQALRSDLGLGLGDFTIRTQDASGVWDQSPPLPYDPGLSPPVTGYYQPVTPLHGQVDVPLSPTFLWTCSNSDCGTRDWEMELGFLSEEDPELHYAVLNSAETSWAPGALYPGLWYWFEPDSREFVGSGREVLATLGGDSFTYTPNYTTRNRLEFATSADPEITVVEDTPFDLVEWTPIPGFTYDLIRGDMSSLTSVVVQVDAGTVLCLAEQDTSGSIQDDDAPGDPSIGNAWFYLLREDTTPGSYGYSNQYALGCEATDCLAPRVPSAGDCVAGGT